MRTQLVSVATFVVLSMCGVFAAQSPHPGAETYEWSGELVAFDATAGTATIKARLVDQEGVADLKRFKAGERVTLWWSGSDKYADAIRRVLPYAANRKAEDRFRMPVELVSTDAPHQYVTFRLRVPAAHAAALNAVKPGAWVTVTSSHRASDTAATTVSIRPYVTASVAASK